MRINAKQLAEFQTLYAEHFGITLSTEEAEKCALQFLALMAIIYKPIKAADTEKPQPPAT